VVALILTVVFPGLGHLYLRYHPGRAAILAAVYTVCINASIVGFVVWPASAVGHVRWGVAGLAGLVWVAALVDIIFRRFLVDVEARSAKTDEILRKGLAFYVDGKLEETLDLFNQMVRVDPEQADGHFYAGVVLEKLGRPGEAKRRFRTAYYYDDEGKWDWEVAEKLRHLSESLS